MTEQIADRLASETARGLSAQCLLRVLRMVEDFEQLLPFVLICTDTETGEQSFSGPIESSDLAARIVDHETAAAGADSTLLFAVAPLYPALDVDAVAHSGRSACSTLQSSPAASS